jgi:hypothetical protein
MKKALILSIMCALSGSAISWKNPVWVKPAPAKSISSIKLAEAKAILSQDKNRHHKYVLGTADGGI